MADSYEQRIDEAVAKARLKYAKNLPFQSDTYHQKEQIALDWGGAGEAPDEIKAVAYRFGITPQEAKAMVEENGVKWRNLLNTIESIRESAMGDVRTEDYQSVDTKIGIINSI